MTKRYTLELESEEISQIAENGNYISPNEAVDILNKQNERIKELENDVKHWKNGYLIFLQDNNEQYDKIQELEKKNQKLKSFRATTYSLINDYLLDSDEINESWREVLTEIKEILKEEEKGGN